MNVENREKENRRMEPFMDRQENSSEIARLRQRIAEEYEAAMLGLSGLAPGSTRHQFITRRMEQMGAYHQTLQHLVGKQEAARLMAETLETL